MKELKSLMVFGLLVLFGSCMVSAQETNLVDLIMKLDPGATTREFWEHMNRSAPRDVPNTLYIRNIDPFNYRVDKPYLPIVVLPPRVNEPRMDSESTKEQAPNAAEIARAADWRKYQAAQEVQEVYDPAKERAEEKKARSKRLFQD